MTTVKDIVVAALKDMGADGLCCPGECGCGLDDLMPCVDGAISWCVPAKKVQVPGEYADDFDEWYEALEREIAARIEADHDRPGWW